MTVHKREKRKECTEKQTDGCNFMKLQNGASIFFKRNDKLQNCKAQ